MALGAYPEVTLAEARKRRDDARSTPRAGDDPAAVRRARKAADKLGTADSLQAIANEWLDKQAASLAGVSRMKAGEAPQRTAEC